MPLIVLPGSSLEALDAFPINEPIAGLFDEKFVPISSVINPVIKFESSIVNSSLAQMANVVSSTSISTTGCSTFKVSFMILDLTWVAPNPSTASGPINFQNPESKTNCFQT